MDVPRPPLHSGLPDHCHAQHAGTLPCQANIRFILIWIRIRGSVSDDYGSWPNLDKKSKFRNFLAFFGKKNFVDFLCLSKSALNTQILEHLEEI